MAQSAKRKLVSEMTDDELVTACQSNEEKPYETLGCGLAIVAVAIIGYVSYEYHVSEWSATFGGVILGTIIAAVIIFFPKGKKTQQYQRELERRHSFPAIQDSYEKITPQDGPDWFLSLKGTGLPHGKLCYVEVSLWLERESKGAIFRQQQTPAFMIGSRPFVSETGKVALDDLSYENFQAVCSTLSFEDMKDATAIVMDGFPCTITAIRKHPLGTGQGNCNLMGISPTEAELPVPKLAVLLWKAAQAVPLSPSVIGSCDFNGNIRVEEI